jgi:DNA-binding HxlR family transcriptional regulator
MDRDSEAFCPYFRHAVELVGRRWSGVILRALLHGATRFTDLRAAVPGLSDRMLAERLRELQEEGIVERHVHPQTPVRVEYTLTRKGRELNASVDALADWADKWIAAEHEPAGRPADLAAR